MGKVNVRNRNKDKLDKNGKPKAANWEYRFEAARIDGKRKHITKAGFKTKKDAEIAGNKALTEYNNVGLHFSPSEMSFSDYLDFWYDNYVKTSCKYNTQMDYKQIIDNHLKPSLGMYKLKALQPLQIQEYVNHKFATGLKKNTLKNIMAVLSGSLKYAVLPAQLIQSNPCIYIKYPALQNSRYQANRTVISIDDFNRILERFPKGNHFHYALMIGFHAGLRISEVYALTWDDIDFEKNTIDVNKLVYKRKQTENKSAWYFGDPKTRASFRTVSVGNALMSELKEYRTMQRKNQIQYGEFYTKVYKKEEIDEKGDKIFRLVEIEQSIPVSLPEADLIFRKEDGEFSSPDSFKYAARIIHYELQLPDFDFHSLRHTHATMLIESGISPKAVQKRLGHERIETTLQTYVHDTEKMQHDAVDVFEKLLSTPENNGGQKQA